jgi:hypothetical protein
MRSAQKPYSSYDQHFTWLMKTLFCESWFFEQASSSCLGSGSILESSYLVDPASSHMLVSKIKPCMSKYKQICTVKLRMAH